jgi:NADH dehydrogenase [ubiquinone] 1 alpha subcomplex assembly factor 5
MTDSNHLIFDRKRVRMHAQRAMPAPEDFLLRAMLERLTDRLQDMNRTFPTALDLGSHHGILQEYLPDSAGIEKLVQMESLGAPDVLGDAEFLPFATNSFDLIISCGSLHWVNDLPGTLIQIQRSLKPDGLFLAMMPGGETLTELRASFEAAEMRGGISPRVSPFVDIRDAGGLLQRAGFALPVVDSEQLEVLYTHPLKLLHDLRAMGQANALRESRKGFTSCSLMMRMADIYMQRYEAQDGRVRATFELMTLTAWKPHASQQQPAKRGSGKVNLSVLGD